MNPLNTKTKQRATPAEAKRPPVARRRPIWLLAAVIVLAVGVLFAVYLLSNQRSPDPTNSDGSGYRFAVGDPGPGVPAPDIVLPSTAGGEYRLSDSSGKTVLLYFQEGVGCQPCWDQLRDIEQNWDQFTAAGVDEIVTITSDSLDLIEQKIEQDGIGGPVLADTDLAVSKTYDANSYGMMGDSRDGHSFILVGPDGVIRWRADYGGSPDYTMYVPVPALLADLAAGTRQ